MEKDITNNGIAMLNRASEMGHAEAMYVLGCMWIDEEPFRASKLFIKGEKMNHMGCRYRLALCYWDGRAVSEATDIVQDYERAAKLLRLVRGEPEAEALLKRGLDERLFMTEAETQGHKQRVEEGKKRAEENRRKYGYPVFLGAGNTVPTTTSTQLKLEAAGSTKSSVCKGCSQSVLWVAHLSKCIICCSLDEIAQADRASWAKRLKVEAPKFVKMGDSPTALNAYKRMVQLVPTNMAFKVNYIAALCIAKQWRRCLEEAQLFFLDHSDGASGSGGGGSGKAAPMVHTFAGRSCKELGLFGEAAKHFAQGVKESCATDLADLREVEGVAHSMQEQLSRLQHLAAITTFQTAPHTLKSHVALRLLHIEALFGMERFEEALRESASLRLLREERLDNAGYVDCLYLVARLYASQEPSLDEVKEGIADALARTLPPHLQVVTRHLERVSRLCDLHAQTVDVSSALESLARIPQTDEQFSKCERMALFLVRSARLCFEAGKLENAVSLAARASSQWPHVLPETCSSLVFECAATAEKLQHVVDAISYYSVYIDGMHESDVRFEEVLFKRATLWQRLGDWKFACHDFARLRRRDPHNQRYEEWHSKTRYMKRREKGIPDFYTILGVDIQATSKDIKVRRSRVI